MTGLGSSLSIFLWRPVTESFDLDLWRNDERGRAESLLLREGRQLTLCADVLDVRIKFSATASGIVAQGSFSVCLALATSHKVLTSLIRRNPILSVTGTIHYHDLLLA